MRAPLFVLLSILSASASTVYLGATTDLPLPDNGDGNHLVAQKTTLSQSVTLKSMSFYVTSTLRRKPKPLVNVSFAWNADDPIYNVTNYRLYYGTQSGVYTQHVDVGTLTGVTISFLPGTTYYAAVTASNGIESPYSNEISFTTL